MINLEALNYETLTVFDDLVEELSNKIYISNDEAREIMEMYCSVDLIHKYQMGFLSINEVLAETIGNQYRVNH